MGLRLAAAGSGTHGGASACGLCCVDGGARDTWASVVLYVCAYGLLVSGLFPIGSWSTLLAVAAR